MCYLEVLSEGFLQLSLQNPVCHAQEYCKGNGHQHSHGTGQNEIFCALSHFTQQEIK